MVNDKKKQGTHQGSHTQKDKQAHGESKTGKHEKGAYCSSCKMSKSNCGCD